MRVYFGLKRFSQEGILNLQGIPLFGDKRQRQLQKFDFLGIVIHLGILAPY